jgi:hypothetical protein
MWWFCSQFFRRVGDAGAGFQLDEFPMAGLSLFPDFVQFCAVGHRSRQAEA